MALDESEQYWNSPEGQMQLRCVDSCRTVAEDDPSYYAIYDVTVVMYRLQKSNVDELDDLEDEVDPDVLEEYKYVMDALLLCDRKQRMEQMKVAAARNRFGSVREISQTEFVSEVNKAPKDVSVVVHLYKDGCVGDGWWCHI